MKTKHRFLAGLGCLLLMALLGCSKSKETPKYPMSMSIAHTAGANALVLGSALTTPLGQPLQINVFRYYLSNFSVVYADGSEKALPDTYFLINEADLASKNFAINVPEGSVTALRFWVGVDSARNVSGVQSGALDPVNGMFWTWNSGYIFAKLEGRSAASPAALQAVTYHIGGFRTGENALRQITIPFAAPLQVSNTSNYKVKLKADVMKWFRGATDLSIATDSYTMDPGPLALRIANNYAQMFSLLEVTN